MTRDEFSEEYMRVINSSSMEEMKENVSFFIARLFFEVYIVNEQIKEVIKKVEQSSDIYN